MALFDGQRETAYTVSLNFIGAQLLFGAVCDVFGWIAGKIFFSASMVGMFL